MKTFVAVTLGLLLGSCATVPTAGAANACGDRCGAMACPNGTFCEIDGHCNARCAPEPMQAR